MRDNLSLIPSQFHRTVLTLFLLSMTCLQITLVFSEVHTAVCVHTGRQLPLIPTYTDPLITRTSVKHKHWYFKYYYQLGPSMVLYSSPRPLFNFIMRWRGEMVGGKYYSCPSIC